jgi:hypothetical protein
MYPCYLLCMGNGQIDIKYVVCIYSTICISHRGQGQCCGRVAKGERRVRAVPLVTVMVPINEEGVAVFMVYAVHRASAQARYGTIFI